MSSTLYEWVELLKNIFITGRPGIGKTTVVEQIMAIINGKGFSIGGMISSELRAKGVRVGFEITNILTGEKGILAHINQREGPQVSKYRVNLRDLVEVGVSAIEEAIDKADLVVIDEVGPMELYSNEFKGAVKKAIESSKPLLGTIHYKAADTLIDFIKSRNDTKIFEVTFENRAWLGKNLSDKLLEILRGEPHGT